MALKPCNNTGYGDKNFSGMYIRKYIYILRITRLTFGLAAMR